MFAITKWSQDRCTRDNVSKKKRKEKIQKSSLHPSERSLPLSKISYANPPPNHNYSYNQNYSPFLS